MNEITGAKVFLQNPDGSQNELQNWKKVVDKTDHIRVIDQSDVETNYPIVQPAPIADTVKPPSITTEFGVLLAKIGTTDTINQLQAAKIKMVRAQVMWSISTHNPVLDAYLKAGLDVQINFNYEATETAVPYVTDMAKVRAAYNAFATYYLPFKTQIKCVCVENEWDNTGYHSGTDIQTAYLNILATVVDENKKFGFPISDGGITDGGIKGWNDKRLNFDKFIADIKNISIDYLNFHWYESANALKHYDLKQVATNWMNACGKKVIINNEFGIRTATLLLWQSEVTALKGFASIAVAYSGINDPNKAITLTSDYLQALQ